MTTDGTPLGDRMKGYENITRNYLPRRTYTIIRLDGRAFHTWTKNLARPYDEDMNGLMASVAAALCQNVEGVKLAYHQSDEISLLLTDFADYATMPWFGGNIQKIVSISASIATASFNAASKAYIGKVMPLGYFDSRVFTIPEQPEVINYFLWRFRDASRNSVQSAGQAHLGHKAIHGLNSGQVQEKLFQEAGINWSEFPEWNKNGTFWKKVENEYSEWTQFYWNLRTADGMVSLIESVPLANTWIAEPIEKSL